VRLQASLLRLMSVIAVLAVGFAVLARASFLWGSLIWSVTLTVLASSVVAAFARRGRSRCFWVSFALLGWGYWYLAIGTGSFSHLDNIMITQFCLDWLATAAGFDVPDMREFLDPFHAVTSGHPYFAYLLTGHCVFTLLFALAGGYLGWYLYMDTA
jgi:hypothetical protein